MVGWLDGRISMWLQWQHGSNIGGAAANDQFKVTIPRAETKTTTANGDTRKNEMYFFFFLLPWSPFLLPLCEAIPAYVRAAWWSLAKRRIYIYDLAKQRRTANKCWAACCNFSI